MDLFITSLIKISESISNAVLQSQAMTPSPVRLNILNFGELLFSPHFGLSLSFNLDSRHIVFCIPFWPSDFYFPVEVDGSYCCFVFFLTALIVVLLSMTIVFLG